MNDPFHYIPSPSDEQNNTPPAPNDGLDDPRFQEDIPAQNRTSPVLLHDAQAANTRRTFSLLGLSIALLFAATTVMEYVIFYVTLAISPSFASGWWMGWLLSIVPLYGFGLPLMLILLLRAPVAPHNAFGYRGSAPFPKPAFTFKHWMLMLLLSFGCMYAGSIVSNLIMAVLEAVTGYSYTNSLESIVNESPLWMTFFVTCVIAPIGEEWIFRKLFIDRARRYGDTTAILLSGLLFGLFHGNIFQFFYAFLLGVILAYIYTRSKNIWWCVGIHAIVNLIGGVVIPELAAFASTESSGLSAALKSMLLLLLVAWQNAMIAVAIVLFCVRRKRRVIAPDPSLRPTGRVFRQAFVNPGMLIAVILLTTTILSSLLLPVITFRLGG